MQASIKCGPVVCWSETFTIEQLFGDFQDAIHGKDRCFPCGSIVRIYSRLPPKTHARSPGRVLTTRRTYCLHFTSPTAPMKSIIWWCFWWEAARCVERISSTRIWLILGRWDKVKATLFRLDLCTNQQEAMVLGIVYSRRLLATFRSPLLSKSAWIHMPSVLAMHTMLMRIIRSIHCSSREHSSKDRSFIGMWLYVIPLTSIHCQSVVPVICPWSMSWSEAHWSAGLAPQLAAWCGAQGWRGGQEGPVECPGGTHGSASATKELSLALKKMSAYVDMFGELRVSLMLLQSPNAQEKAKAVKVVIGQPDPSSRPTSSCHNQQPNQFRKKDGLTYLYADIFKFQCEDVKGMTMIWNFKGGVFGFWKIHLQQKAVGSRGHRSASWSLHVAAAEPRILCYCALVVEET